MPHLKFSVITVVLNGEKVIEDTIRSVIGQNYSDLEYIIIDGGSSDRTLDIVNKYKSAIHCLISEKDKGIYEAMNKGVQRASGDYFNFMNAGDYFVNMNTLAEASQILIQQKPLIACGDVVLKYPDGFRRINRAHVSLYDMPTYHQAIFFSNEVFRLYGGYDIHYMLSADFDIWQRVYLNNRDKILLLNMPVSINNLEGISNQNYFCVVKERVHISFHNLSGKQRIQSLLWAFGMALKCYMILFLRHLGLYRWLIRIRYGRAGA